jgi:hypothetical protein
MLGQMSSNALTAPDVRVQYNKEQLPFNRRALSALLHFIDMQAAAQTLCLLVTTDAYLYCWLEGAEYHLFHNVSLRVLKVDFLPQFL